MKDFEDMFPSYEKDFLEKAKQATKFEENGLFGLRKDSPEGGILLEPEYEQIDVCNDFVILKGEYDESEIVFADGSVSPCCPIDPNVFIENGHLGLKDENGKVVIPAEYDDVYEWYNKENDVIYVRKGKEVHYYNHAGEEILTGKESTAGNLCQTSDSHEEKFPATFQTHNALVPQELYLCLEAVAKRETAQDCYAFGQWVRLNRISRKDICATFEKSEIAPMRREYLYDICQSECYYSARLARAKGEGAVMKCVEQIKSLNGYMPGWNYLVKICINHNTALNPHDLYEGVFHYQLEGKDQHVSIGYDDALDDGEVSMFHVHYDAALHHCLEEDVYTQQTIPNGTYEEVVKGWEEFEHKDFIRACGLWHLTANFKRPWSITKQVADFLYSKGACDVGNFLWCTAFFHSSDMKEEEFQCRLNAVEWAQAHGGNINHLKSCTVLLWAYTYKESINDATWIKNLDTLLDQIDRLIAFLKDHGALTNEELYNENQKRVESLSMAEIVNL